MFLKRIEMQGFKSFADKTSILFDEQITGIVGPNGCGKSNIVDAIRWVLGEQSAKSLRGSNMSDVIFAGSTQRKTINMAEVTLIFDNSRKNLNAEMEELEITRKIYRTGESEYFINRVSVRLKDIHELILDSGIGKDSLSMVSQGNITSFAEAKPIERRALFEDAAGVAKYKKRKLESLNKLERTKDNMDRLNDILVELERQVNPLRRAAKKAELYKEKKERLQRIEISVLVDDIEYFNTQMEEAKKLIFDIDSKIAMHETSIHVHESSLTEAKKEQLQLDLEINALQDQLLKLVNEIQILETRKIEIDEKRKYALEKGSSEDQIRELNSLFKEARLEFEDRSKRLSAIQADIETFTQELSLTAEQLLQYTQNQEGTAGIVRRLQNREEVLMNLKRQPFIQQAGVQAIVDSKDSIPGILGVVAQVLNPQEGYEEAISVALGAAMYHVVTINEESARSAIQFLKKNESGRVTFLPNNILRENHVNREQQIVCENAVGFLGVAKQFVTNDANFDTLRNSLLGNVIVVDRLENGNRLSTLLKYQYKIVTLEGDVIHKGGSMTGGKIRNNTSPLTIEKELEHISVSLKNEMDNHEQFSRVVADYRKRKTDIEEQLMEKRLNFAQLEPIVDAKRAKFERLRSDLELIAPNSAEDETVFADDLIINLNESYSKRDEVTSLIKSKREKRLQLTNDVERKDQQIRQFRNEYTKGQNELKEISIDQARLETKIDHDLKRLATEYQLTFEYAKTIKSEEKVENAKEEVLLLRQQIENLGNINMDAPDEYSEVSERYDFLKHQYEDLEKSRDQLLTAIDEMDSVMITQFKEMFDKINYELQGTFTQLFGGGKARLILENPEDILNTGIDIDVQPPGKSVQNIRLFSGGEKTLIAICVLFAILKAREVPLCIFDEVEAALDQANVERFARYLRRFDNTQFVLLTHRPGTMAQCDSLFGVTMPKNGVSQLLKVRLAEAKTYGEEQEIIS